MWDLGCFKQRWTICLKCWSISMRLHVIKFNVVLTVHCTVSVQLDQPVALFTFSLFWSIASVRFKHFFAHHQEVLYVQQLLYFCVYYVAWKLVGSEWSSWWWAKKCSKHIEAIKLLAPEFGIKNLAHPVCKMRIIQEPKKVALWNKNGILKSKKIECAACLKNSVHIFV
jgi:hypothetical protein